VADQNGREFLSYAVRRNEKNPKEYPWTLGLPPGTYRLTFEETSVSSEVVIPLKVPPGEGELDLGTRLARPSHLELLRGELAPDLAVRWRVGDRKQLSQLRGKVVVLYFWGYWCVPCVKGMPSLMQTADRLQGEPVVWIAIHDASLDTVAALEEQLRRLETAWGRQLNLIPALDEPEPKSAEHGGITCTRYAVRSWPAVVLIDQKGKVAGSVPKEDVEAAIQRLLQK
jgi:thiol-disulfide isomerase/thioredoxin